MIKSKISNIISLAYELSVNSDTDIFVSYAPHCDLVSVTVYENGWSEEGRYSKRWDVYYDTKVYRTEDSILSDLDSIIEYLSNIK